MDRMDFLDYLDQKDIDLLAALGDYHEWANSYFKDVNARSSPLKGNKEREEFILRALDLFIEFDEKIRTEYNEDIVNVLIDPYGNIAFNVSLGLAAIGEKEKALMTLLQGRDTYMEMAIICDERLLELFGVL